MIYICFPFFLFFFLKLFIKIRATIKIGDETNLNGIYLCKTIDLTILQYCISLFKCTCIRHMFFYLTSFLFEQICSSCFVNGCLSCFLFRSYIFSIQNCSQMIFYCISLKRKKCRNILSSFNILTCLAPTYIYIDI